MIRKYAVVLVCFCLPLASVRVGACEAHFMFNPDKLGFVGGTVARLAGLTPPEPVFDLEHPAMARAEVGEKSEVVITYSRPFFSKNVRLELTGTSNVQLFREEILLEERRGTIKIPYELSGSGYDAITMTVSGEHKGDIVRETARIYVRANIPSTEPKMQVSER